MRDDNCLIQAFSILDKDADGYIGLEEFKNSFGYQNEKSSNKVHSKVWNEIDAEFAEIDQDRDGKIDFEEFKNHMKNLEKKGRYESRPDKNLSTSTEDFSAK